MAESKKQILVVDDEKSLAHALELKLKHDGFDVVTASNGEEALAAVDKTKFDLILLDLIMPQTSGFEVLETLQKNHSAIPVIVTTNLSQEEDQERAKQFGAKDYLIKSNVPMSTIIERIKAVLG